MKLDLDALTTITSSKAYNQLPLAVAARSDKAHWWQMHEAVSEAGARLQVWEAAQYIALLFDTYPGLVNSVRLSLNLHDEQGEVYADNYTYINEVVAHDQATDLLVDEIDAIEAIDDARVLWAAVDALNDVATLQLASHIEMLRSAFGRKITSAEQARAVAQEMGGEMTACIEAEILAHHTQAPASNKPGPRF